MSDVHPPEEPEDPREGFAWEFSSELEDGWDRPTTLPDDASPSSGPLQIPEGTFGPYELLGILGRGGMGVVFRAKDPEIDREIALKIILEKDLRETRRERFRREGQVAAKLAHPGIVRVHTAGEIDGLLYLAYELVPGCRELRDAMDERDLRGRVELVRDAARALGYAHSQGVVHRDVKPANILVDSEDRVRVTDFGLAAVRGAERLTQSGAFVGTPTHMAPEQFCPGPEQPVGPHTDVWGLGVILYRALTGEQPFAGSSLLELGAAITRGDPRPPRELDPEIPDDVAAICLKALSVDGVDRYVDASAMADDLESSLRGEPVSASASTLTGLRALRRRWPRLHRLVLSTSVTLSLLGVAAWSARSAGESSQTSAERRAVLRAHKLEQRSQRLVASHLAIAKDQAALSRLAAQAEKLTAGVSGAPPAPLTRSLQRVRTLQGLLALSTGDVLRAEALATELAPGPTGDALRGALLASRAPSPAEADEAERVIDQGIAAGCERLDVHAWRILARQRANRASTDAEARRSLAVLSSLEDAQRGVLPDPLRLVKARLHLRCGQVPLAWQAAQALRDPPRDLLHELAFARAGLLLDDRRREEALALLEGLDLDPALASGARARLYGRLSAVARELFAAPNLDLPPALTTLKAMRLLEPDLDLPRGYVQALVSEITVRDTHALPLVAEVADLAPSDAEIVSQLAQAIVRTEDADAIRPHMGLIERAIALAPDDARRAHLQAFKCFALHEVRRPKECMALCDEILPKVTDKQVLGRLFYSRAWARQSLGDLEGALEDLDSAAGLGPRPQARFLNLRVEVLWQLERWDLCLTEAVRYAREASPDSTKHGATVVKVWLLAKKLDRLEVLEEVIGRLVELRPRLAGWWARLAWTRLKLGHAELAAQALEAAAHGFVLGHTPRERLTPRTNRRLEALAPRARRLVAAIQAGDPTALSDLGRITDELDQLRRDRSAP